MSDTTQGNSERENVTPKSEKHKEFLKNTSNSNIPIIAKTTKTKNKKSTPTPLSAAKMLKLQKKTTNKTTSNIQNEYTLNVEPQTNLTENPKVQKRKSLSPRQLDELPCMGVGSPGREIIPLMVEWMNFYHNMSYQRKQYWNKKD